MAGRVLRPIRDITATARQLSAENIGERVPVRAPRDELADLAATVNGMLDRVQRGIAERDRVLDSQRMFAANAAHELRTPLTTVRTAIDVTLDGEPTTGQLLTMAADIRDAVEHGRRTLDGLLLLAGSQAGPRTSTRADLAGTAGRLLDDAAARADALGLAVRRHLAPAPVDGEPVLLERLVGNLVDNALRHNVPGGELAVTTGTAGGAAFLRVENTGRPLSAEEARRLPEPFVRGEGRRPHPERGVGLGLAIVRAVATAHQGSLTLAPRPGGGLSVTVRLPGARRPGSGGGPG
ncbi:sensor histidine kinase [Streptomyces capparidis]